MDHSEWLEELIRELAAKHRVILDSDDPILVSALLNKEIIDQTLRRYQVMLDENQKSLAFQLATQNKTNEELLTKVADRLIKSSKQNQPDAVIKHQEDQPRSRFQLEKLILPSLIFVIGVVFGIGLTQLV
jgi:hypothetical protein